MSILDFFKFKWLLAIFNRVAPYVKAARPIVETIAAMTPNRTAQEILALFQHYGIENAEAWLALPVEQRGAALIEVATQVLLRQFPQESRARLRTAIELVIQQLRGQR